MIGGREARHSWTPAGAKTAAVVLGERRNDKGEPVFPYFHIRGISGLRSAGEPEDNADPKVGSLGENPRLSRRGGKTVVYECTIKAKTLKELREAEDTLQAAFADMTQVGRMDVTWHPSNKEFEASPPAFYEAKCLTCDIPDAQETKTYERLFVVAFRLYDPRHFDEETVVFGAESAKTNEELAFA